MSHVKDMTEYGPPDVLIQREQRKNKYIQQLVHAQKGEIIGLEEVTVARSCCKRS